MLPKKVLTLLMLLFSLVLIACSSPEEAAPTADSSSDSGATEESADETVALKMTAWDIGTTPYWQAVIDAYEAQNPNVTVELVEISSQEYQDKVNIMLSGGDETDIIVIKDIPGYSAMVTRGQILPLNSYVEADGIDTAIFSGAVEELTYEGQYYGLPFRSDIWILYYNKDLFDAAGVAYPDNDLTWAEYEELARQLTSGEGNDKVYGTHHHTWRSTVQIGTIQGDNTVIADDYSFMQPMYDMIVSMQDDGIIMDYGSLKAGNVHYSGVFQNEQVAMLPMGSWFIGSMIAAEASGDTDFAWGVAKFPHPDGIEAGTTAGTLTGLAINENSAHQDAAWEFIKFYSGVEGAKVLAGLGNLPAVRTDEVLSVFTALDGVPAEASEALQTASVKLEAPMDPNIGVVEQILNEEHDLIMTNSVSVADGIAEMTSRVNDELGE